MKCLYGHGTMAHGAAPFHIDRKGYHVILNTIPPWVWTQCGEAYCEEAAVEAIRDVIRTVDKHTESLVERFVSPFQV
jgi:hypothetical protein